MAPPQAYDPARDPVLLAVWARVAEGDALAWCEGRKVPAGSAHALDAAQTAIRRLMASTLYPEIHEEIRRALRIPPLRRMELNAEELRFLDGMREAAARGMA